MRLLDNFKRWSGAFCARLYAPLCALFCGAVLATVLHDYPLGSEWLLAALLLYCAVLWRKPEAWLLLVPAALPVLDLAPWTGRFFVDEFDALLAATLLLRAWRCALAAHAAPPASIAHRSLVLFCLSAGIALLVGAWPLPALGLNGLNHYYSPYNGVRLAKGLVWALLLWPLLRAALSADHAGTQRRLALGMGLGVFAAALGVGWERLLFTGLFEFDSSYRAVGLFSAMHTGGAYIEAYFALALPFLAWWTWSSRRWPARLAGSAMLAIGSYALLVSYARAGYLAAAVALLVLLLAPSLQRRPRAPDARTTRAAPWPLLAGLTLLAALAFMIMQGDTMQRRYASSAQDLATRVAHWHDALRMMALTPAGVLTGMGLGSYPRTFFLHSSEGVTPTYQALHAEHGDAYLAIAAGDPLYFEQSVRLHPHRRYQLSFRARSADVDAALAVPICEKWLLYSHNCIWQSFAIGDTHGQWQRFSASLNSAALGALPRPFVRPLKLSMFNPAEGSLVDIDDVSLKDDAQHEQLRNGDFGKGMDFWFFSSNNHLPWHLENTWLLIAFEQGLFGLLTFAALVLCAVATLTRRLRAGDTFAAALAAALAAFLVLSLLDSVFDFPRMSMMVYLILLLSLHVAPPASLQSKGEGSFK